MIPACHAPSVCRLGGDGEVNELIGAAFRQVPSFKFLPLVYQVASRMSAGEPSRPGVAALTVEGRSRWGQLPCHQLLAGAALTGRH